MLRAQLALLTIGLVTLLISCMAPPTTTSPVVTPRALTQSVSTTPTPVWSATIAALQAQVGQEHATAVAVQTALARGLPVPPTSPPLPRPTDAISNDRQLMDDYVRTVTKAGSFSGAILVAQHGHIMLRSGYGVADADYALANTPQTRFRLGSVTKQFTAMGILILQARGTVDVADTICRYLSDCPATWQTITIHQLLTHTSGIPNYTETPAFTAQEPWPATPEQIIAPLRSRMLLFAPGTGYGYSNANYVLLGMIIERVSGKPYATFLHDAIFAPLGMRDTGYDQARAVLPNRAVGYLNATTEATYLDLSNVYAAGALYSTIDDLYRWDRALAQDRLIPPALSVRMFTPVRATYAYGWRVTRPFGRLMVGHTGHVSGFHTYVTRYPDDDAVIIVLSNFEYADVQTISLHLAALLFHTPEPMPLPETPAAN